MCSVWVIRFFFFYESPFLACAVYTQRAVQTHNIRTLDLLYWRGLTDAIGIAFNVGMMPADTKGGGSHIYVRDIDDASISFFVNSRTLMGCADPPSSNILSGVR